LHGTVPAQTRGRVGDDPVSADTLLQSILAHRATRVVIMLFWWWLGWHFIVEP
jgi:hypothetical protein